MTLRFLASGDCMRSLSSAFRIGHSTVSKIVNETCRVMYEILAPTYLQLPDTNKWRQISNDFSKIWNFPNCVGAGDGKHFAMQCPNNGGSNWYSYKGFHSISCLPFAMQITVSLLLALGLMVERVMRVYLHHHSLQNTWITVVWVSQDHQHLFTQIVYPLTFL